MNQLLAKGPDRFLNNLAGVILQFRNGRMAAKGDVRKMYNCIKLTKEDAFTQCFLWRDMNPNVDPVTYQVTVNNIGVKPAGAIATVAFHKNAELFSDKFPVTSQQLQQKSYVDDLGLTAKNLRVLKQRTEEADQILSHANMRIKKWVYSGDKCGEVTIGETVSIGELDSGTERMLGVLWEPGKDVFKFSIKINLSSLKNKTRTGPDLTKEMLQLDPPKIMTRRQYYSQVQSLFDPIGLLSPVLLRAKVLLRLTWEGECSALNWDDPLPEDLVAKMVNFFLDLFVGCFYK